MANEKGLLFEATKHLEWIHVSIHQAIDLAQFTMSSPIRVQLGVLQMEAKDLSGIA